MKAHLIFFLLVVSNYLYSQNALTPDIIPSANATSMAKYEDFPVSYYTGQAQVNIPLASISSHGIEMNFNLDYDGSGIIVDQHPGWVGQNWTLNGGGVITRAVNGFADEEGVFGGEDYYNSRISYFYNVDFFGSWFNEANTNSVAELKEFAEGKYFGLEIGEDNTQGLVIDTEPDIFTFNFLGYAGKFFMDQNAQWKIISDHNLKIELDVTDTSNYQDPLFISGPYYEEYVRYDKVLKGFKIIDEKGYKYTFGFNPNALEYSLPFFRQYSDIQYFNQPNLIASAWYLTKVEDFRGTTVFNLNYERSYFTATILETLSAYYNECKHTDGDWLGEGSATIQGGNGSLISPVYLTSVNNFINDRILFRRSNANDLKMQWANGFYHQTNAITTALCGSPGCGAIPYPYLQDEDYLYSFDAEAALNNYDPTYGLMWQKLDTILTYRNNNEIEKLIKLNYNNDTTQRLNLLSVDFIEKDGQTNPSAEKIKYEMIYDNFHELPPYFSRKTDHFGYYNNTTPPFPSGAIMDYEAFNTTYYPYRNSNETYLKKGQLISIKYPTGGITEFEYELNNYTNRLSDDHQSILTESGNIGGLRIKQIKYFDNINVNPTKTKTYHYKLNYQTGGTNSSGILALKPKYAWHQWLTATTLWPAGGYRESSWSNNILVPLGNKFENHIAYSEVAEVNQDSSFSIFKYVTHNDIKDELPYGTLNLAVSPYSRFGDKSHMRGKLKIKADYNKDNAIVMSEEHYYSNETIINGFNEYGIDCNTKILIKPCGLEQNYYFTGNAIKVFYNKFLKDSLVVKHYFNNLAVKTKESYLYARPSIANNKYAFLQQKSILNSEGKTYSDHYNHTFNHTSSYSGQQSFLTLLTNQHRLEVVNTENKVDNVVVDGTENLYEDFSGTTMLSNVKRLEYTWLNGVLQTNVADVLFIENYSLNHLKLTQQRKNGWLSETINLGYRGYPATWSYSNHSKSYTYYQNDYLQTYTDIDGQQQTFLYDDFNRLKQSTLSPKNVVTSNLYHYPNSSMDLPYFKTKTDYPSVANSAIDSIVNITYLDGLGRSIQEINKYAAPDNSSDVISKAEYDKIGRLYRQYEPIAVSSNNGNFYTGSFNGGYSQQTYLKDPLNRTNTTTPPSWYATAYEYGTNISTLTAPDYTYPIASLYKNTIIDPDGKKKITYTDKIGRKIADVSADNAESLTAYTWYIYDAKNRLYKVIPPGATIATTNLIYEYQYDGADNITYKKVPDAAAENYVYNNRDLLIGMRNAILTTNSKWLVTHYDDYGRPVKRGYHNLSGTLPTTDNPTINTLLEEYFYDGYNGSTTNSSPIYKGKLKKKRIKALDDLAVNSIWQEEEYFYDSYGRASSSTGTHHLSNTFTKSFTYDFADNPLQQTHNISGSNGINHTMKNTYDHQGRKLFDIVNLNSTGDKTLSNYVYNYKNELIEKNLGRYSTTGDMQYLQSLDYTYNNQGWLTKINNLYTGILPEGPDPCETIGTRPELDLDMTSTDAQDLFAMKIDYDTIVPGLGITRSKNGNISNIKWDQRNYYTKSYSYNYDFLDRVLDAKYGEIEEGDYSQLGNFDEKFSYDVRGNIMSLTRKGLIQKNHISDLCFQKQTIDSLSYEYATNSNKLLMVEDNVPCDDVITLPDLIDRDQLFAANIIISDHTEVACDVNLSLTVGTATNHQFRIDNEFIVGNNCSTSPVVQVKEGNCTDLKYSPGFNQQSNSNFIYNTSGSLTFDPNKKISFYYNHLNLPYRITGVAGNDELQMLYASDGTLLQRKYIKNNITISKTDYIEGKEYVNDTLKMIHHNDGRVLKDNTNFTYEYNIKDHLGNVRVTFSDANNNNSISNNERRSINDYYSFGMKHEDAHMITNEFSNPKNRYLYNGKELVEEMDLELHNYGARNYDATIGRFTTIDPLADLYPSISQYSYVANNPLIYRDPTGAYIVPASQKEWEKQTGLVIKRRDKLQKDIDKLVKKAANKGWSSEKLAKKIGNKQDRVNSLNSTISDFKTLEGSTQGYSLRSGTGEVGGTYFDKSSGNIVIDFNNTANFVHEATHAGQFETGDLAFDPNIPQGSYAHDLFDEVAAYKAELAYIGTSVGGVGPRASSFSAITPDFVKEITTSTGVQPYANHGLIPININSIRADLLKAYPHAISALIGLPTSFKLSNLTDIIYKK